MRWAAGAAALPIGSFVAIAEDYPSRPITWVVPFPVGGPQDTLARILTERMSGLLGQPIVIENVGGAAGSIGVGRVARAPSDGYTIIQGIWSTHVVNGVVYKLSYDVFNDFAPIAHVTDVSQIVVARKSMQADNLQDLIAWLRANPDKAWAGTAGAGSPQHIFGLLFQEVTGTRFGFVHYRGGAPATQDLVGGWVDLIIDCHSASPRWHHQSLRRNFQNSDACGTGHSDGGRSWIAHFPYVNLDRRLGAQGYLGIRDRQNQCRHCRELG
jgi:tripartite-type tricarboxylate transporter receptor subunit TctC